MTLKWRILLWLTPSLLVLFLVLFFSAKQVLNVSLAPVIAPTSLPFTLPVTAIEQPADHRTQNGVSSNAPTWIGPLNVLSDEPAYFVRSSGTGLTFQSIPYQAVQELPVKLTSTLILWGILAFVVAWAIGAWGILHSLQPLFNLGGEISNRNADNLSPLKAPLIPELKRSILALNDLFCEMQHTLERRKQQEDAARRFAYGASHELRNPLAALRLYLDVIRANPHEKRAWEGIDTQTTRIEKLLDSLLSLARLEGQAKPEWTDVQLKSCISKLFQGPIQGDAQVKADPALLELAVRNLLDNARFHAHGVHQVTIEVQAEQVWIWVEDQGTGIPNHIIEQAFEPFVKQSSGTGLGLALVKAVAQMHRGQVHAENHGCGARVGFCIGMSTR